MSLWYWALRLDNTTSELASPINPFLRRSAAPRPFPPLYREIMQSACIDMEFDLLFSAAAHDRHNYNQFSRRVSIQNVLHE